MDRFVNVFSDASGSRWSLPVRRRLRPTGSCGDTLPSDQRLAAANSSPLHRPPRSPSLQRLPGDSGIGIGMSMNTVCEVCGNIGYKRLLVCCRDCKCSAVHLYCLDKVIFDASLAQWWCYECHQRRGEVTCSRSLDKLSSERSPSHAHFGSAVHQPVTKRVNTARNARPGRKRKEYIPSANYSLESDDLQALPKAEYVLSYRSILSEAQKERVIAFIQEIRPKVTVYVAVMQKRNVQPPGPFLGISKDYAFPHFPHRSTNVTLQTASKSNKWHPKFYKRNASRKNMLMGQSRLCP